MDKANNHMAWLKQVGKLGHRAGTMMGPGWVVDPVQVPGDRQLVPDWFMTPSFPGEPPEVGVPHAESVQL